MHCSKSKLLSEHHSDLRDALDQNGRMHNQMSSDEDICNFTWPIFTVVEQNEPGKEAPCCSSICIFCRLVRSPRRMCRETGWIFIPVCILERIYHMASQSWIVWIDADGRNKQCMKMHTTLQFDSLNRSSAQHGDHHR